MPSLHESTPTELLRLSRDALRRAGAAPAHGASVPALVEHLGVLSELLGGCRGALEATCDELSRRSRAGVVDAVAGPFAGDPDDAVAATALWAQRAASDAARARGAVDNAHVSAAGLAEPDRPRAGGRRRRGGRCR